MSNGKSGNLSDMILESIKKTLEEEVNKEFDAAIVEATERLNAKRKDILAHTVMKLSSYYTMQDLGTTIRIEVKNEK